VQPHFLENVGIVEILLRAVFLLSGAGSPTNLQKELVAVGGTQMLFSSNRIYRAEVIDLYQHANHFYLPLSASPRTTRIANVLGLTDDRVLTFYNPASMAPDFKVFQSLRRNVMQLFDQPKVISCTSSLSNLGTNKQLVLALDAPGVPSDPLAYPLTWSTSNMIAVACGRDVYFQNLQTRLVDHLCRVAPRIRAIEWATQDANALALGGEGGTLNVWDSRDSSLVRDWKDTKRQGVYSLNWHNEVLAVGERPGSIGLYDVRVPAAIAKMSGHKVPVYGLKWSPDGKYLASGDASGFVQIWDATACKTLGTGFKKGGKMRHKSLVKALAWCPWKPELLATGSFSPDGSIRIWNTSTIADKFPSPTHTIPLRTTITSLHWSPHCKELLSTHGDSWTDIARGRVRHAMTNYSHSMTIHSYPNYNELMSVTAHTGPIGHSCLSPDGTNLFTLCPMEEAMKMWKVWGVGKDPDERGGSVLDGSKFVIR